MSLSEGIGHATAEDELVDLAQEVLDDTNLRRYLRAAHDGNEGALDVAQHIVNSLYLFLHQQTKHLVVSIEIVSDDSR